MIRWTELTIFIALFTLVSVLGFVASRWRRADLGNLDEWGLGGRRFGSWITWFLLGGDLYTAYTFVAVPALMYAVGAVGFYVIPYSIILFPIALLPLLRLWSVSRVHGYVTPADFVRGRYGSRLLALVVAVTGIVATMPYIALQLAGLEAVLRSMGVNGSGFVGHLPLLVAFVVLAAYTYNAGLRAPAMIAFVKDGLIYLVIAVAIVYLPLKLGGWGTIFGTAADKLAQPNPATGRPAGSLLLSSTSNVQVISLALGSALACFLYPHAVTGVLASAGRRVIRRNMVALPAYTVLLGLLALLGYFALTAGVKPVINGSTGRPDSNTLIPNLFTQEFSPWFAGIALAAIGIAALVPAAVMSIGAANLWTRNIYREFIRPGATPAAEAKQAKLASLVVKLGAVVFVVFVDPQFAVDLQLIGGVIILQTLPAVAIALYSRWFHRWGLVAGWLAGMAYGTYLIYSIPNPATGRAHFGGSALPLSNLSIFGWHPFDGVASPIYVGVVALIVNLVVAAAATLVARALKASSGIDETRAADYHADSPDETAAAAPLPVEPWVPRSATPAPEPSA
jgi:solute:Na+ symporter, SSS family